MSTHSPTGEERAFELVDDWMVMNSVDITHRAMSDLIARVRELEGERESARKALREIGERAVVDWQDELVGLVSVGLGTADWDSVTTMEKHVVDAERALRRDVQDKLAQAEQRVQELETLLNTAAYALRRAVTLDVPNSEWFTRTADVCDAALAQARAEEREACALLADHGGPDAPWNGRDQEELDNLQHCAARIAKAIRARRTPDGSPGEGER